MQPIKIINNTNPAEIIQQRGKIKLAFEIISTKDNMFYDCCFKVILADKIVRKDISCISTKGSGVAVEFDGIKLSDNELNATCQIFQGDRIICSKDHQFLIDRG